MAGMNLRSIRVDAWWALRKPVYKVAVNIGVTPVPANTPFDCGAWRPGHGAPKPIAANSPDETDYILSPEFYNAVVDPIPARSL